MTAQEIIVFFRSIIDDALDADFELDLLNNAKDQIELERSWQFLKTHDNSLILTAGNTYLTEYTLPVRFGVPLIVALSSGNKYIELKPVSFELRIKYKNQTGYYYIDYANGKLHITGDTWGESYAINIFYTKTTADLTVTDSPSWPFGYEKSEKLLAFKMAELYFAGLDTDEVNRLMAPEQIQQQRMIHDGMVFYDNQLKLKEMDGSAEKHQENYSGYSIEC